jgi:uncharacterized membrane protein (DUF2068 family)
VGESDGVFTIASCVPLLRDVFSVWDVVVWASVVGMVVVYLPFSVWALPPGLGELSGASVFAVERG